MTDARRNKTHDDKDFLRIEQLVITVHQVSICLYPAAVSDVLNHHSWHLFACPSMQWAFPAALAAA